MKTCDEMLESLKPIYIENNGNVKIYPKNAEEYLTQRVLFLENENKQLKEELEHLRKDRTIYFQYATNIYEDHISEYRVTLDNDCITCQIVENKKGE